MAAESDLLTELPDCIAFIERGRAEGVLVHWFAVF